MTDSNTGGTIIQADVYDNGTLVRSLTNPGSYRTNIQLYAGATISIGVHNFYVVITNNYGLTAQSSTHTLTITP